MRNVLRAIEDAVRWRLFKEFENVSALLDIHPSDHDSVRIAIGHKIDVVADVMGEFQRIANEVAVSGRIDRIA